jgi:hypothetical protein
MWKEQLKFILKETIKAFDGAVLKQRGAWDNAEKFIGTGTQGGKGSE